VCVQAVGGMLFRCEGCALAFCEDHLPGAEVDVVMECRRFAQLGYRRPGTACYIRCSRACVRLAETQEGAEGLHRSPAKQPASAGRQASAQSSPSKAAKSPTKLALPSPAEAKASLAAFMAAGAAKSPQRPMQRRLSGRR
jgi:hypothetical protein